MMGVEVVVGAVVGLTVVGVEDEEILVEEEEVDSVGLEDAAEDVVVHPLEDQSTECWSQVFDRFSSFLVMYVLQLHHLGPSLRIRAGNEFRYFKNYSST